MTHPTLRRRIYDFFLKHWVVSALLLTSAAHWFIFLRFAGSTLGFIGADGQLTTKGHWITWPLFFASVICALLKTFADKYNEEAKTRGGFILQRLLECVNAVTRKKLQRFCDFIQHPPQSNTSTFLEITQPRIQIQSILENIQVALSEIFGISRDRIGLSLLYSFGDSAKWDFLESVNISQDLDSTTLLANPDTTLRQVLDGHTRTVFYPNKRIAAAQNKYLPGPMDKSFNIVGSIICRNISITKDHPYLKAVLSITTYGKQLCHELDADAVNKIENIILPVFDTRLQLELALLFIREAIHPQLQKVATSPLIPQ